MRSLRYFLVVATFATGLLAGVTSKAEAAGRSYYGGWNYYPDRSYYYRYYYEHSKYYAEAEEEETAKAG